VVTFQAHEIIDKYIKKPGDVKVLEVMKKSGHVFVMSRKHAITFRSAGPGDGKAAAGNCSQFFFLIF
jgi:hypothetical protein